MCHTLFRTSHMRHASPRPQARARDAHAAEDREKKRPKHPPMAGGEREDEAVVIEVRGAGGLYCLCG